MAAKSPTPDTAPAPAGAAGGRTVKHGVSRLLIYVPPWAIWLLWWPVALTVYGIWGRDYDARPWMSLIELIVTTIAVVGCVRYAPHRGELLGVLATVSTALFGGWLLVASIVGPTTRPVPDLWGGIGASICVYWTMRRALMGPGDQVVAATGPAAKLVEALRGARLGTPRVLEGGVVETTVEVDRGNQTIRDVQQQLPVIAASVPGLRPGAMRLVPSADDAGMGTLITVPADPLAEGLPWPGPSAPGESVHLGAPVGTYDIGRIARMYVTGDDNAGRALVHWLVMGASGSGKSTGMRTLVGDLVTRRDFVCWAHDHVKGIQTLAPLLGGLDWVTMDVKAGKVMLGEVRKAIRARTDYLGRRGIEQWTEDCGLSLLMVWIEEATELADLAILVKLVREARSVGIVLVLSLQRASHSSLDTDTRSQLGGSWCFGVRAAEDAAMCLPDAALDAGAAPELWGVTKPGSCYAAAPGIPVELWAAEIRTWRATHAQLVAACELGRAFRQPLDAITAGALGPAYAARPTPTSFLGGGQPVPGAALATTTRTSNAVVPGPIDGELDDDDDDRDDEEMDEMPRELDPQIQVDPDQPIGRPPVDLKFPAPDRGPKLSTEAARAIVQRHLATLIEGGQSYTRPADIAAMRPPTTMTREWVRLELHRLAEEAAPDEYGLDREPTDPPGTFRILAPTTVRELARVGG
jgi:hypothetical protein